MPIKDDLNYKPCKPLEATLLFLGTASMRPSATRNVSGNALRIGNEWTIIDCGEGTQHQIGRMREEAEKKKIVERTRLSPGNISRIFITHLHGDHCFGLPGLLCLINNNNNNSNEEDKSKIVQIVGPKGLRNMVRAALLSSASTFSFQFRIDELWEDDDDSQQENLTMRHYTGVFEVPSHPSEIIGINVIPETIDGGNAWRVPDHPGGGPIVSDWNIYAAPLVHSVPSVGYVFHEHPHHGNLDSSFLQTIREQLLTEENRLYQKSFGIHNPLSCLGLLQKGKAIKIMKKDGIVHCLEPKDCMSPNKAGRKVSVMNQNIYVIRVAVFHPARINNLSYTEAISLPRKNDHKNLQNWYNQTSFCPFHDVCLNPFLIQNY